MFDELKIMIADLREIEDVNKIFLSVGADEAIDIIIRIFCYPGSEDHIIVTPPTYGMYSFCAKMNDVKAVSVPLTNDFDLDLPHLVTVMNHRTKIIFLCSPGSKCFFVLLLPTSLLSLFSFLSSLLSLPCFSVADPTGKLISLSVISDLAKVFTSGIIVVDEAYIDFSQSTSNVSLLSTFPNLIILQSLSSAFGLNGVRMGMAFSSSEIVYVMNNLKVPYSMNRVTVKMILEAFQQKDVYHTNVNRLLKEREFLMNDLKQSACVKKVHPSNANFILFEIPGSLDVSKLMLKHGVVCRFK
jgi:histidinol-phosphate aminotransferase